jgi:hypothetical protein
MDWVRLAQVAEVEVLAVRMDLVEVQTMVVAALMVVVVVVILVVAVDQVVDLATLIITL